VGTKKWDEEEIKIEFDPMNVIYNAEDILYTF
jgi:preprotein translocase subunit Sec61beta